MTALAVWAWAILALYAAIVLTILAFKFAGTEPLWKGFVILGTFAVALGLPVGAIWVLVAP